MNRNVISCNFRLLKILLVNVVDLLLLLVGHDTAYNIARKLQNYYTNSKEKLNQMNWEQNEVFFFFFFFSFFLTVTIYNLQTYYNLGSTGILYTNIYNTTNKKQQKNQNYFRNLLTYIRNTSGNLFIFYLNIFFFYKNKKSPRKISNQCSQQQKWIFDSQVYLGLNFHSNVS